MVNCESVSKSQAGDPGGLVKRHEETLHSYVCSSNFSLRAGWYKIVGHRVTVLYFSILGGYEEFSALYPFLRTQKIIYMPRVSCCIMQIKFLA